MMMKKDATKMCFVGSIRSSRPLKETDEKKFRVLTSLGELFVIGFASGLTPKHFTQHAHFYLLPELPFPVLRYLEMFVITPFVISWLMWRHKVRIFIAQSPFDGFATAVVKSVVGVLGYRSVLIVENHGDFEENLFMQRRIYFPALYRFFMRRVAGFTIRQAEFFRAVSNSSREQLERWKPGCRVFQFVAWTDIESFRAVGLKRTAYQEQTFLYAGVLIPRKGVIHLINAFATLVNDFPRAHLYLIGKEEDPAYTAMLKARVQECGIAQQVEFVAEITQQQLAGYMEQAGIFVLPSYSEGLPRVVIEAMFAALPTIATAVSGIPEVITEGETGMLIPPGDEKALAEKMRWMLEHPEQVTIMGQQAFHAADASFSTDAYVRAYRQILHSAQDVLLQE